MSELKEVSDVELLGEEAESEAGSDAGDSEVGSETGDTGSEAGDIGSEAGDTASEAGSELDIDEEVAGPGQYKSTPPTNEKNIGLLNEQDEDDDEDDEDDNYLQKFTQYMRDDLIGTFHPESKMHNYEEIKQLAKVTRNKNGIITDELHKTSPILTKYEKTRILGQRAKQIEAGGIALVQIPPNVIDSYLIAKLELAQNKIPFIIRRPLPNGGMEYWYVSDLENL